MGKESKEPLSRRSFLSLRFLRQRSRYAAETDTVKMLTADGRLVEVDKSIADEFAHAPAAGNADILRWMKNPSIPEK